MRHYRLLELCSRVEGHPVQHELIRQECRICKDWDSLLTQAENEGIAPLLKKHLEESESDYPAAVRRSLSLLAKRHQQKSRVRTSILLEILQLCRQHKIEPILIKGAALSHSLYPDPALRPMGDMDILFHPAEVDKAQDVVRNTGFVQSKKSLATDHYHLPALCKTVDNVDVCLEFHRGLYPNCPPYYPSVDFDYLLETGRKILIEGVEAAIFSNKETLHYIYQHAFHAPLVYEPYKLINATDVISFTEKYFNEIDWKEFYNCFPVFDKSLPLLHHISPWDFSKIPDEFLPKKRRKKKMKSAFYIGWPRKRRKDFKAENTPLWKIFRDTFLPPFWWVCVYYNVNTIREYLACILCKHPQTIFWWKKLIVELSSKPH